MVTARRPTAFQLTTRDRSTSCNASTFLKVFVKTWLQPLRSWFSGCYAGFMGAVFFRTPLNLLPHKATFSALLASLSVAVLFVAGCGQTAKQVTAPSAGQVHSYFGGPFQAVGLSQSTTTFDHAANQVSVSTAIGSPGLQAFISGTFVPADTGFLAITENFANGSPQNPPMTGAWAVEIPGAGAIANLLSMNGATVTAGPAVMADSSICPNFSQATPFLYVTVPTAATAFSGNTDTADFGSVDISVQGSAVTFATNPGLVGPQQQPASTATGGCSNTALGALTAYPLNSFGSQSTNELISIGATGLLVSSYHAVGPVTPGAFGGGTGVIGVAELPSTPLDVSAVLGAHYNGFFYAPQYAASQFTVLASAYGNHTATSQACTTLQASLAANNGQGAKTVQTLPSANSLYGGEFLTTTSTGVVNDPTTGSENCDVVIDLGQQGSANGLFPNATVFIGSNFPPFSATNAWSCPGSPTCAVSFPAAAVVGNVLGRYVIFVRASGVSTPPAQLPGGPFQAQPIGIYLFQKM